MPAHTVITACGAEISFDNVMLAIEFLRMLAHQIVPEQFVSLVQVLVPSPDAVDQAKQLVIACMGQSA